MQIGKITNSYQPMFNGEIRFPMKDGSTAVFKVLTNNKIKIKELSYDVFKKGKVIKNDSYTWKRGVEFEGLSSKIDKISKQLGLHKEDVSDIIFDAYLDDVAGDCMFLDSSK